jgi:hypothetical protein
MPPWFLPVLVGGGIVLLAVVILLFWVNARGRFMFTDCIVHNRGAIAQPWREYRVEGNRYFVLQLVILLASLLLVGVLAFLFFLGEKWDRPIVPFALVIFFATIFVLAGIVLALIMRFVVPVMYRQRCDALSAFRQVWGLIAAHPGVFVLFVLFYLLLYIAGAIIGCLLACVTCCIAALPYLGTVILLPVVMLLYAFPLCFIRQFGDPYDVWAGLAPAETPGQPDSLPPVQETPPSPPSPPPPLP